MVLRISPDTFWSALGSSVFILLFVCHSEAEWAFYFHVHFQILGLLRLVNIVILLLRVSCYPSSSYDHQSLFVAPLAATVLLSTERSSIFINPEVYPRDTREFIIFFHTYTFVTPFLVSLPDCLVGTVLGRHVHPPTTTHKYIQHAIDATPVISSRYQYKQEEGLTVLGASIDRQLVPQISLAWTKHNLS